MLISRSARKFLGVSVARTRSRNPPNGPFASGRNRWWDYLGDVINAHPGGKRDVWHEYKCQLFSARCRIGADFVRRDWFNATSLYAIRHSLRFIARDPSVRRNTTISRSQQLGIRGRLINLQFPLWVPASETFSTAARVLETRLREFEDLLRAKF